VNTRPQQRILFLLAGTVTLAGILLTVLVSRWFVLLPALAGANQLLYFALGCCPASLLLNRIGVARPACTAPPVSPIGRP
jgi:hypothetical protein